MIVRAARAGDGAAICAITNPIIRETLITFTTCERSAGDVETDIARRGDRFLVAETEGVVLGFATYGAFRAGPGYAHTAEHSIQLAPAVRGRGVGRALMRRLIEVARADDIRTLVAGISAANTAGIAFHTAIGFREVGRMAEVGFKSGQWLDLVLMQKNLAEA